MRIVSASHKKHHFGSPVPDTAHGLIGGRQNSNMKSILQASILGAVLVATAALPQGSGIQRSVVERADVSVPGREAVIAHVEIAPGARAGRHTHPGEEI